MCDPFVRQRGLEPASRLVLDEPLGEDDGRTQQPDRDGLGQPVGDEQVRRGPAVADDAGQHISRPSRRGSRSAPEERPSARGRSRARPAPSAPPATNARPARSGQSDVHSTVGIRTDGPARRLRRCAPGRMLSTPGREGRTRRHRVPRPRPGPELSGRRDPGIRPRRRGDGRSIGLRSPGPAAPARPGPAG